MNNQGGAPPGAPTQNVLGKHSAAVVDKCSMCDQLATDKTKTIQCSMCIKHIHFWCAESGALNETALRLTKTNANLHYICKKCSPSGIKSRLVPEDHSNDVKINALKVRIHYTHD